MTELGLEGGQSGPSLCSSSPGFPQHGRMALSGSTKMSETRHGLCFCGVYSVIWGVGEACKHYLNDHTNDLGEVL